MKNLLILLMAFGFLRAQAQFNQSNCQKIGFADTEFILSKIPEFNKIQNQIQVDAKQYERQFMAKVAEYESKLKEYQQGADAMLEIVRLDKEKELRRIQESIQNFQQDVQVSLRKKETDLLSPILNNVGRAIDAVAVENGFSFVINSSTGATEIIQFADKKFDISEMVLTKLGIQVETK